MSANKSQPHVLVLPEDDANRQMANGFILNLDHLVMRRIQVLEVGQGWKKVLDRFKSDHIRGMDKYPQRLMILLIDFDGQEGRLSQARAEIPGHLRKRVFVLGVWTEPEALRRAHLGSFETIGRTMAKDCREETDTIWGHDLLRHNAGEIERLRKRVRPILFQSA